jgi:hypothetical protein
VHDPIFKFCFSFLQFCLYKHNFVIFNYIFPISSFTSHCNRLNKHMTTLHLLAHCLHNSQHSSCHYLPVIRLVLFALCRATVSRTISSILRVVSWKTWICCSSWLSSSYNSTIPFTFTVSILFTCNTN